MIRFKALLSLAFLLCSLFSFARAMYNFSMHQMNDIIPELLAAIAALMYRFDIERELSDELNKKRLPHQ